MLATEIGVFEWAAVAGFFLIIGPLALLGARQMWRDDPHWADPPSFWVSGRGQWNAFVRATPSAILALTCALSLAPVFAFLEEGTGAFGLFLLPLLAGALGGLAAMFTTYLFNFPKLLVPPPRRGDPSVVRNAARSLRQDPPDDPDRTSDRR